MVILDVMGSGSSEGGWETLSAREIDDVAWIIDNWIPAQPWSNGKVGMYGPSYMGITSYLAAGRKPRHLKAIFPGVIHADTYRDIFFQGGIFEQEFMLFWARFTLDLSYRLPPTQLLTPRPGHWLEDVLSGLKALEEHREQEPEVLSWLARTTDGPFFDERSPMTYWEEMAEMPIMTTAGWWGIFTRGSMLNYTEITREKKRWEREGGTAGPMRIIVGPWYHTSGAFMEGLPSDLLHRRWFDWHLKADEDPDYRNYDILDPSAPVILYVLGREQWRREKEWPLSRARYETLYLSGKRQEHDQNESLNNGSLSWSWEMGEGGAAPRRHGAQQHLVRPDAGSVSFHRTEVQVGCPVGRRRDHRGAIRGGRKRERGVSAHLFYGQARPGRGSDRAGRAPSLGPLGFRCPLRRPPCHLVRTGRRQRNRRLPTDSLGATAGCALDGQRERRLPGWTGSEYHFGMDGRLSPAGPGPAGLDAGRL